MQSSGSSGSGNGDPEDFVDIWARNLEEEFSKIRQIVRKYPYVAMVRGALYLEWTCAYVCINCQHVTSQVDNVNIH